MFSLINKKPHIFRLFTKTNHFQIRSRAPFLSKFKQSSKNTSEEPPSNIKIPTSTLIDLSYTNLEKELGLTLKQETKPEFKPRSNKNISKLEMQLEEITTESSLTANYKEDILKSKFGKHLKGHTIKQQKDTSDIEVMNNPQKEQKNRLENQLEEIEYKIKTAEDFKDSPDEILLRQYEEAQIKKKERTNAQLMRYVKGEEGIDYLTPPPNMFDDIEKEVSYLKEEFEEIYSKFTGSNNSQTRLSQFEWMEKKENLEVIMFQLRNFF